MIAQITFARNLLVSRGWRPRNIDAMPAWDFLMFMATIPAIQLHNNPLATAGND